MQGGPPLRSCRCKAAQFFAFVASKPCFDPLSDRWRGRAMAQAKIGAALHRPLRGELLSPRSRTEFAETATRLKSRLPIRPASGIQRSAFLQGAQNSAFTFLFSCSSVRVKMLVRKKSRPPKNTFFRGEP